MKLLKVKMKNLFQKIVAILVVIGLNGPLFLPLSLSAQGVDLPPVTIEETGGGVIGMEPIKLDSIATPVGAPLPSSFQQTSAELPNPKDNCKLDFLNKGLNALKGLIGKKEAKKAVKELENLSGKSTEAALAVTNVGVTNPNFGTTVDLLGKISGDTGQTQEDTAKLRKKAFCLDSIATNISRILLQQVTKSIVDWINNGFKGTPSFVADSNSFFRDLAHAEINGFGLDLKASGNPYAGPFFAGLAGAVQTRFSENARYSFNDLMQGPTGVGVGLTVADFQRDFGRGGWSAWLALTQVPYNNPIGAQIEFTQELGRRLRGNYQTASERLRGELTASGGFLGDERCFVNGQQGSITRREHNLWLAGDPKGRQCRGVFRYVTPGQVIANKVKWADTSIIRQMELSDTISDSLAAVFDALMNQLWGTISKGLFKGTAETALIPLNLTGFPPPEGSKYIPPAYQNSDWFQAHPDFNIAEGINQAIIDEQRTYLDKLEKQNNSLSGLIKWINQLDYCIPGPSPDWEQRAGSQFELITESIPPFENWLGEKEEKLGTLTTAMAGSGAIIGATVGSIWPGIGTAIGATVGAIVGVVAAFITSIVGNKIVEKDLRKIIANYLVGVLDVNIIGGNKESVMLMSSGVVVTILEEALNSYKEKINRIYDLSRSYMPTVTPEARTEFGKIIGYQEITNQNLEQMSAMKNVIKNLEDLKPKIDALVIQFNANPDDPAIIQQLKDFGEIFARLTNQMISGDDIAIADDLLKQVDDRTAYVKDFLVGTPTTTGCEYELNKVTSGDLDRYVRRQSYPLPVNYYYNPSSSVTHSSAQPLGDGDGFLYYSSYYNTWAGPFSGAGCDVTGIGYIPLSAPEIDPADNTKILGDIVQLDPNGSPPNNCGVITRRFERLFGVY